MSQMIVKHEKAMNNQDVTITLSDADISASLRDALESVLQSMLRTVVELEELKRKEYLSTDEVEKLYSLNAESLNTQRCRRKGPAYVKNGSRVLYRQQAIKDFLEARRVRTMD